MTDKLGNSLSDRTQDNLEVSINSSSDLLHKEVSASLALLRRALLWLLFRRFVDWLALFVILYWWLLRLLIFLWHYRRAVEFVIVIIREYVVLLSVNDSFDNFSGVVTFCLQDWTNYIHNLWSNWWTSHENTLNNGSCNLLKLCINVLD